MDCFLSLETVVETCLGNDATILDTRLNTVAPNILQCNINSKFFINAFSFTEYYVTIL